MESVREDMEEFRRRLDAGVIQRAYGALIGYMMSLRTYFAHEYGDGGVSGLYQGYMDMTYFALFPPLLKERGLKIAIVFNYEAFRFEAWLAASNRQVQRKYWELVKHAEWPGYRVVAPAKGIDSIVECDLAGGLDVGESVALTEQIGRRTREFVTEIERFVGSADTK